MKANWAAVSKLPVRAGVLASSQELCRRPSSTPGARARARVCGHGARDLGRGCKLTCDAALRTTTFESDTLDARPVSRCPRTNSSTSGSSSATRSPISSRQRWETDLSTSTRWAQFRGKSMLGRCRSSGWHAAVAGAPVGVRESFSQRRDDINAEAIWKLPVRRLQQLSDLVNSFTPLSWLRSIA